VIKVEREHALTPDGRADERYSVEGRPVPRSLYRATFLANNRNKRSIALDLKSERGAEIARALVERADIVYENFRPGAMARLGLDYESCRRIKPDVIYVS